VLGAKAIPAMIERDAIGWRIEVPISRTELAQAEIAEFEEESRHWPPVWMLPGSEAQELSMASIVVAMLMLGMFAITGGVQGDSPWFAHGSANAALIHDGEWWRAVTALWLHADFGHVAGNAICAVLIGSVVCRRIGNGMGWLLISLTGLFGDLATTTVVVTSYSSIGASTAMFGAIGLLGGWRLMDHLRFGGPLTMRGIGLPLLVVATAVILMSAGPNVDVTGHIMGAIAGVALGVPTHRLFRYRSAPRWQWAGGIAASALSLGAWALALTLGQAMVQ